MTGKINLKILIPIIIVIVLLCIGIFVIVNLVNYNNKNYTLEQIAEEDYKYFVVFTDEKYGVINANRRCYNWKSI